MAVIGLALGPGSGVALAEPVGDNGDADLQSLCIKYYLNGVQYVTCFAS